MWWWWQDCIVCSIYVLVNFVSPAAKENQNIHCIYFMVIFVNHLWNVLVLHCERLGWRHAKQKCMGLWVGEWEGGWLHWYYCNWWYWCNQTTVTISKFMLLIWKWPFDYFTNFPSHLRVFTWKYHQKFPWFDWITELDVRCPHYFKPWGKCLSRTQYPLQICSCYLVLFIGDVSGKTKAPLICLWTLFVCILYQFLRDIYRVIVLFFPWH